MRGGGVLLLSWAVAVGLALGGCGGGGTPNQTAAARSVVQIWLTAIRDGNGRAYCSVLSKELMRKVQFGAEQLGHSVHRHVTCAQFNSVRPPGVRGTDLADLRLARRQSSFGVRIDSIAVTGNTARVRYSWIAPRHPSPILSFKRPAHGNRVHEVVTLGKEHGAWKIG